MKYRKLGRTNLDISVIAFGCGAVGGVVFKTEENTAIKAVQRALNYGINWFDTAPVYGQGQSEETLGHIFNKLGVHPYVSTKVLLNPKELKDIPGAVKRSVENSLKRLRLNRVELIQLHNWVTATRGSRLDSLSLNDVLGRKGVADAFEVLQNCGMVDFFGFTAMGDTECLYNLIQSGRFHTMQAYYNLLNPSGGVQVSPSFSAHDYGMIIDMAKNHNIGVIGMRVLAAGVLAGKRQPNTFPRFSPGSEMSKDKIRAQKIKEILGVDDKKLYQIAMRFVLMNKGTSGVLIGFSDSNQIDEAVNCVNMPPLSDETTVMLKKIYSLDPFCI